jgi:hypothetical protein
MKQQDPCHLVLFRLSAIPFRSRRFHMRKATAPSIEIRLAGAVVRVGSGMEDAAQLTAVLRAVRASASRA